jgi:peptidoglycan/xylan/chitin deacetylase (PgdA/CDA1 family)
VRPLYPLAAAAIALMVPTLGGGSDISLASSVTRSKCSIPHLAAVDPVPTPAPLVCMLPQGSPGDEWRFAARPTTHPRELLLSFDDGPDLRGTPLILEELDRRGLKAIFFVTGWRLTGDLPDAVARRDLVRKIAMHGHLVANHTMTHKNLCDNPTFQADEIDDASTIVALSTGVRPLLFRSPYGAVCRSLAAALEERDLPNIRWNLDPQEWKSDNDEAGVIRYLTDKLSHLEGRGILLMHDTHMASVNALPAILDWIARENHRAVREDRPPITLVDYSVVVPDRPLPETGIETIVSQLTLDAGASIGRLLRH